MQVAVQVADRLVRVDRDEDAGGPRVYLLLGGGDGERVRGKGDTGRRMAEEEERRPMFLLTPS